MEQGTQARNLSSAEVTEKESTPEKKTASAVATDGAKRSPFKAFLFGVVTFGPLKYVFKLLQKMIALVRFPAPVEDIGSMAQQTSSPMGRRFISGKKRLGRLTRFLISVAPQRLQTALGYPMSKGLGEGDTSEEVRQSPTKPCGKGSKRKAEEVDMEEQHSWIEALVGELPEEEEGDLTYQPSKSESDSEEYRSKNDTESDLEFEVKDGQCMLKESAPTEDTLHGEPVVAGAAAAVDGDVVDGGTEVESDVVDGGTEVESDVVDGGTEVEIDVVDGGTEVESDVVDGGTEVESDVVDAVCEQDQFATSTE